MRDTVYVLVFEGFADWQVALGLSEIRRPGDWEVRTVGFTQEPVTSLSGLQVIPDGRLDRLDQDAAALLILPGGHVVATVADRSGCRRRAQRCMTRGAPVAAIAEGVFGVARAGLINHCRHTGNWASQIDPRSAGLHGHEQYDANVLAVSDGGVITASHLGSVEFAREIIHTLDLYNRSDREYWYRLFKHAIPPPWFPGVATGKRFGQLKEFVMSDLVNRVLAAYRPLYLRGLLIGWAISTAQTAVENTACKRQQS